eukprot:gene21-biopygen7532
MRSEMTASQVREVVDRCTIGRRDDRCFGPWECNGFPVGMPRPPDYAVATGKPLNRRKSHFYSTSQTPRPVDGVSVHLPFQIPSFKLCEVAHATSAPWLSEPEYSGVLAPTPSGSTALAGVPPPALQPAGPGASRPGRRRGTSQTGPGLAGTGQPVLMADWECSSTSWDNLNPSFPKTYSSGSDRKVIVLNFPAPSAAFFRFLLVPSAPNPTSFSFHLHSWCSPAPETRAPAGAISLLPGKKTVAPVRAAEVGQRWEWACWWVPTPGV